MKQNYALLEPSHHCKWNDKCVTMSSQMVNSSTEIIFSVAREANGAIGIYANQQTRLIVHSRGFFVNKNICWDTYPANDFVGVLDGPVTGVQEGLSARALKRPAAGALDRLRAGVQGGSAVDPAGSTA